MIGKASPLRGDIQGMRAVAVVLVLLGHAGVSWLPGGYIGVDVFFVISGFLITGILARSLRTTGRISIVDFYVRRARRILPAATVVLVAICIGSAIVYTEGRLGQVTEDTTWAAFFGVNIHYASAGTGYFDTDTFVSPVQHYWSLAVEEQFYLVWPLLMIGCGLLATLLFGRHGDNGQHRSGPGTARVRIIALRLAFLLVAAGSVASLVWSAYRTDIAPTSAYFSTLTRAHELGIGALLAIGAGAVQRLPSAVRAVLSWAGLAAIGYAATQFTGATAFPGLAALVPVLGAALVIAGGTGDQDRSSWPGAGVVLGIRPMRWVGDISYSLYLWHWPCLILPAAYLGRDLRTGETFIVVAIAIAAAAASYRWVETPFRGVPRRQRAPEAGDPAPGARPVRARLPRGLALWPIALTLVIGTATVVNHQPWQGDQGPALYTNADPEPRNRQTSKDPLINDVGFAAELARAEYPLPDPSRPELDGLLDEVTHLDPYGFKDGDCFAVEEKVTSGICRIGVPDGSRTIVALGDSHMAMWLAPIVRIAKESDTAVIPLLKQRCMPFDLLPYDEGRKHGYEECPDHTAWVEEQIDELKPDVVLISSLYFTRLVHPDDGSIVDQVNTSPLIKAAAERTLARLRSMADRVVVLGPTPLLKKAPTDCLGTRRATRAACSKHYGALVDTRDRDLAAAAAAAGAQYVSMLPWFCDHRRTCPIVVRDRIVYRDQTHVTRTYALRLQPVLEDVLGK